MFLEYLDKIENLGRGSSWSSIWGGELGVKKLKKGFEKHNWRLRTQDETQVKSESFINSDAQCGNISSNYKVSSLREGKELK